MYSTEDKQTDAIKQIAIANISIGRLTACIIAGGIVTFALFVTMHALIDQENSASIPAEPFVMVSSILDIPDEKIIKRATPKPIPQVKSLPATRLILPQEPSDQNNFSSAVEIPTMAAATLVFDLAAADQQPRPRVRVDPRYPANAASNGIEGFVKLSFGVSASGEVINIHIVDSQPAKVFDRAAKQALRKWRYQPKMVSGSAVGMDGLQVQLDFTLGNSQ